MSPSSPQGLYGHLYAGTHQGRQPEQQDRHVMIVLDYDGALLGVMDGHRGSQTAQTIEDMIRAAAPEFERTSDPEAEMKSLCRALAHATRDDLTGSTLLVAYVSRRHDTAVIATIGDSYGVVYTADDSTFYVPRHDVSTNADEVAQAEARGGHHVGSYISIPGVGNLQMTRSLGDADLRPVVLDEPEIFVVPLPRLIVLATDGIEGPPNSPKPTGFDLLNIMTKQPKSVAHIDRILSGLDPSDNATMVAWVFE
jgi:serine/threonine protein phosphatase PrpC